MVAPHTQTIAATDGVELFARTSGPTDATPIVLVHGYPDTGDVWQDVAARLAVDHHVIVHDVRGAGRSGEPHSRDGYRLDQLAADLRSIVDELLPGRRFHLVGHDWGSVQSWESVGTDALADRIASFTSISGPCLDHVGQWMRSGDVGDGSSRSVRFRRRLRQTLKSWYIVAFQTPLGSLPWRRGLATRWPDVLQRLEGIETSAGHPADTLARDGVTGIELYRANVRDRLRSPRDRNTHIPVQLVVPTADRFVTPAMADAALTHCSTLERCEVPDGHWGLLLRRPDACADLITDFIGRVDAGAVPKGHHVMQLPGRAAKTSPRFDDQLVVVTGAGSGIGRETAIAFAGLGATVVCADITVGAAEETVGMIATAGGSAFSIAVDVGDEGAMEAFVKLVLDEHGVPDVVVNNAGIGMAGPFLETTTDDWRRILDVNLWGVIHGCRLFGNAMVERGAGGHIVNTSSASAFTPSKMLPAYATTKAAVLMLSECLRAELATEAIGVSAICPGLIATNITGTTRFVGTDEETQADKQRSTTALYQRRNYTPDRVATAIVDAVVKNKAVVPVSPEAYVLRTVGRFPRLARVFARRDLG